MKLTEKLLLALAVKMMIKLYTASLGYNEFKLLKFMNKNKGG